MTAPLAPLSGNGRRGRLYPSGNASRERLLAAIQGRPGLTLNGVCRASGMPHGNAIHHLGTLRGHGLVVAYVHGFAHHYFPADWTAKAAAVELVKAQPALRRVLEALDGRLDQKTLVARLPGMPRSTVQNAIRRLLAAGAVRLQRQGRRVFYEVA
ncbi:MAG: hypothetical protein QOI63_743 [Thermoplasmata archaeon]|jgi:predicted transcriptional regulator|nr:hypothetical protein [Thermoplasmata archaeon]